MYSNSNSNSISKSEFKRLILIGIQIRNFFDELTDENESVKDKYQQAVEEKYIKSFTFYAIKSGKSYAELEVMIDWNEHQRQIDEGNLIIKTKSKDGILAPTKNIATRYKKYAESNGFTIIWRLSYAEHVDIIKARKRFHTFPANIIERADPSSDYESRPFQAGDLTELTYTMRI